MGILVSTMGILVRAMEIRERISAWSYPQVIFCDFERVVNSSFQTS